MHFIYSFCYVSFFLFFLIFHLPLHTFLFIYHVVLVLYFSLYFLYHLHFHTSYTIVVYLSCCFLSLLSPRPFRTISSISLVFFLIPAYFLFHYIFSFCCFFFFLFLISSFQSPTSHTSYPLCSFFPFLFHISSFSSSSHCMYSFCIFFPAYSLSPIFHFSFNTLSMHTYLIFYQPSISLGLL